MRTLFSLSFGLLVVIASAGCSDADDGWTTILDASTTGHWQQAGPGRFVAEDGLLRTSGGMGLYWYTYEPVGDAVIRIEYKTESAASNSGVFIRIPGRPIEPWMPVMRGYEVQIDDSGDAYHQTGVLYSLTEAQANPGKPGAWNVMEITLDGPRTMVRVNGALVTDYAEGDLVPDKQQPWEPDRGRRLNRGYIGLQNHGPEDTVYFRSIKLRPLEPDA